MVTDGEPKKIAKLPEAIQPLIKEFKELFPKELSQVYHQCMASSIAMI